MSNRILSFFLALGLCVSLFSFDLPEGWFKAGSKPQYYDMGVDVGAGKDGKNAASIKALRKQIDGFGTLMQNFKPDKYLGKKIKMTAWMKSNEVASWAGFWLRVDQAGANKSLSFDNIHDRSIKGTTEWKKYEIVLSVPASATNIAFGALLDRTGQIWFDEINFEVLDNSVASTGKSANDEPVNLNFDK
jgi:hypothetical protein